MTDFLAELKQLAEDGNLPEEMVSGMVAAYKEGRINENTDADWHRPGFNFREEIWKELLDAANYTVEAKRQGELDEFDVHMILQFLKCAANKLKKGGDTDD